MKQVNGQLLLTGIIAGMTAALLVLGANAQPFLSSVLYAASAMPILIVGLGWGNLAAIVAIAVASLIGAIAVSPIFALIMAAFMLLPAGWLAHLSNLARPASEIGGPAHLTAWYPLSDILLHLCALVTLAVILVGIMIGYGRELTDQIVDLVVSTMNEQNPAIATTAEEVARLKSVTLLGIPIIQGGTWVMMLFAAYYIATRIVSASGRALRPLEDIPSALRMNRNALFVFLAGILGCFAGGTPALIGATLCGTFGAGFLISGFASLHLRTRGKDWRVPALILVYLSMMMLFPAFIVFILGLADTRRTVALTPTAPGSGSDNSNS